MLGTISDDTTDEAALRYCKKDPKTSKKGLSDEERTSKLPKDGKEAECTFDSKRYLEGGSYYEESRKASRWIITLFKKWNKFFDEVNEREETDLLEKCEAILPIYDPRTIGCDLIPSFVRSFKEYRAAVIKKHSSIAAEDGVCSLHLWLLQQTGKKTLTPLYNVLTSYFRLKKHVYPWQTKASIKKVAALRAEIHKVCVTLHRLEKPDTSILFNGDDATIFLIELCSKAKPVAIVVVDANMNGAAKPKSARNMASAYSDAVHETKQDIIINSYYSTNFKNLRKEAEE